MKNFKTDKAYKEVLLLGQLTFIPSAILFMIISINLNTLQPAGMVLISCGLLFTLLSLFLTLIGCSRNIFYYFVNFLEYINSSILLILITFTTFIHTNDFASTTTALSLIVILGLLIISVVRTTIIAGVDIFD